MGEETKKPNLPYGITRRRLRNRLFKIRFRRDDGADDLKEHIESQFTFGQRWDTFTFTWDMSPNAADPFKVISEDDWEAEGGRYDHVTGGKMPSAFTHQK